MWNLEFFREDDRFQRSPKEGGFRVFISHRGGREANNKAQAARIQDIIERLQEIIPNNNGIAAKDVFVDINSLKHYEAGVSNQAAIFAALEDADLFVCLLDVQFFESQYCVAELLRAIDKKKTILFCNVCAVDTLMKMKKEKPPEIDQEEIEEEVLKKLMIFDNQLFDLHHDPLGESLIILAIAIQKFFDNGMESIPNQHELERDSRKPRTEIRKWFNHVKGYDDKDIGMNEFFLYIRIELPLNRFVSASRIALYKKEKKYIDQDRPMMFHVTSKFDEKNLWGNQFHVVALFADGLGFEKSDTSSTGNQVCLRFINYVKEMSNKPKAAIVCLRFGAKKCAQLFEDAGVERILWIQANTEEAFLKLQRILLQNKRYIVQAAEDLEAFTAEDLEYIINLEFVKEKGTRKWLKNNCDIDVINKKEGKLETFQWNKKNVSEGEAKLPNTFDQVDGILDWMGKNFDKVVKEVRQCDIKEARTEKIMEMLGRNNGVLISDNGRLANLKRCQAVAFLTIIRIMLDSSSEYLIEYDFESVYRVASKKHLKKVKEIAEPEEIDASRRLIWFDLQECKKKRELMVQFKEQIWDDLELDDTPKLLFTGIKYSELSEFGLEIEECYLDCDENHCALHCTLLKELKITLRDEEDNPIDLLSLGKNNDSKRKFAAETIKSAEQAFQFGKEAISAIYTDGETNYFRINLYNGVTDLNHIRDVILDKTFDSKSSLQYELDKLLVGVKVSRVDIDRKHVAIAYEEGLRQLEQLTSHQQETLDSKDCEGVENKRIHIKAPAGAGKTFLGLHLIRRFIEADKKVLYIGNTDALCCFVYQWLNTLNLTDDEKILKDKGNDISIDFLACREEENKATSPEPIRPKRFTRKVDEIADSVLDPVPKYDLIVIDEAHHLFSEKAKILAEKINQTFWVATEVKDQSPLFAKSSSEKSLILLSDDSQALIQNSAINYPKDMITLELKEVVRSTKKLVTAASMFEGAVKSETDSLPSLNDLKALGPPIKTYCFSEESNAEDKDDNLDKIYVEKVCEALEDLIDDFENMSLDNRLAIIISSERESNFKKKFKRKIGWKFKIQNCSEASRNILRSERKEQRIIIDTVDNFDGLERLFVIAVDLDERISNSTSSTLYRAMTRANFKLIIVNRYVRNGMLEFLGEVEYDKNIDIKNEREIALNAKKIKQKLAQTEDSSLPNENDSSVGGIDKKNNTSSSGLSTVEVDFKENANSSVGGTDEKNNVRSQSTADRIRTSQVKQYSSIFDTGKNTENKIESRSPFSPYREQPLILPSTLKYLPQDFRTLKELK